MKYSLTNSYYTIKRQKSKPKIHNIKEPQITQITQILLFFFCEICEICGFSFKNEDFDESLLESMKRL